MKKADWVYALGSVFLAVTSLCYCATLWFSIPVPRYYPLEHAWKWANEKGVPSQGWYGMQLFAYLAAGLAALVFWMLLRRRAASGAGLSRGVTRSLALGTLGVMLFCLGYLLYHEFHKWGVLG